MQSILPVDSQLQPFVKAIFALEDPVADKLHALPFYADGYPGILYSETASPIILQPLGKELPPFFLYGQTIEPIQLEIAGAYKMIVFQLYPFATRLLLGINPKEINDECYDLHQVQKVDTAGTIAQLQKTDQAEQPTLISDYILQLLRNCSTDPDNSIKLAVSTLISCQGRLPIHELREQLFITERTFERRFAKEVGVSPKQFARIIQFSYSLDQLQESDYKTLTDVAYDNGFADQSHFIRTFKKYTGQTPKGLLSQLDSE